MQKKLGIFFSIDKNSAVSTSFTNILFTLYKNNITNLKERQNRQLYLTTHFNKDS